MKTPDTLVQILKGEAAVPPYFFALMPLGWAYSAVMRVRAALYRAGILANKRLPCRVISVGNITAGGTGKTPMTILLAGMLTRRGLKPAVITRGYGGAMEGGVAVVADGERVLLSQRDAGDEAYLMAKRLPGVPVVMGRDRYSAGLLAVERFNPDVIILDDGYQHMALERDLNILLLDAARPFGNGHLLPMGYLREPVTAAGRADAVVFTRSDMAEPGALDKYMARLLEVCPSAAIATAAHVPSGLYNLADGSESGLDSLSGARVFGFSGIAAPASFALILKRLHANIIGLKWYPDHHAYTGRELAELASEAQSAGADVLVTTEKDAVRLERMARPAVSVLVLKVEMSFVGGGELVGRLIDEMAGRG